MTRDTSTAVEHQDPPVPSYPVPAFKSADEDPLKMPPSLGTPATISPATTACSTPVAAKIGRRNEQLATELNCPICESIFENPVALSCTHHICQDHVQSNVKDKILVCPVCRVSTQVSSAGILPINTFLNRVCKVWKGQLKADFRSSVDAESGDDTGPAPAGGHHQHCQLCSKAVTSHYCSTCRAEMCGDCLKTRHSDGFFKTHAVRNFDGTLDFVADEVFCEDHLDEKLNMYCTDCHYGVCAHCLLTGKHKNHKQMRLSDAYEKGFSEQKRGHERTTKLKDELDTFLVSLHRLDKEIEENEQVQRASIEKEIDELKVLLDTKRLQLLSKSEQETKKKKHLNSEQIDKVQKDRENVQALENRIVKLCDLQSQHTFLALNRSLYKDMTNETQLSRNFNPTASSTFRTFNTETACAALNDLELGVMDQKKFVARSATNQELDVTQIERASSRTSIYGINTTPRTSTAAQPQLVARSSSGLSSYVSQPMQPTMPPHAQKYQAPTMQAHAQMVNMAVNAFKSETFAPQYQSQHPTQTVLPANQMNDRVTIPVSRPQN